MGQLSTERHDEDREQRERVNHAVQTLLPHLGYLVHGMIEKVRESIEGLETRAVREEYFGRPRQKNFEWRHQRDTDILAALEVVKGAA